MQQSVQPARAIHSADDQPSAQIRIDLTGQKKVPKMVIELTLPLGECLTASERRAIDPVLTYLVSVMSDDPKTPEVPKPSSPSEAELIMSMFGVDGKPALHGDKP